MFGEMRMRHEGTGARRQEGFARRSRSSLVLHPSSFLCALLLATVPLVAVPPLPADRQIPATVVRTVDAKELNPGMHMPTDVALDSAGNLYIADGARDRIVSTTPEGKVRWATTRPAEQQLKRPVGLTVDAKENLWIADTDHSRLVVISPDQKLVELVDLPAAEGGKPVGPTDVLVTPDLKRTYVTDNPNHRLLVRDNGTRQWTVMGKPGRAIGMFQYPFMLALGQDQDVLITEAMNARLQVLSRQHNWAGAIGVWGVELGQLFRPKGVAVDAKGRIYVGDSTLYVIQVFDARGRIVGALTDAEGRPMKFQHPMGMTFDKAGNLYVIELRSNHVTVLSVGEPGTKPAPKP